MARVCKTPWWRALGALAIVGMAVLVACGGGVGSGGTGAFASGPITGFGSIIVQDIHFDESSASIDDDSGAARTTGDLRLGTVVEVDSGDVSEGAAAATHVRIVSALVGSVDSVTAGSLVVIGQTVRINAGTVLDDSFSGGVADIHPGDVVEVYGFVSTSEIVATRIEPKVGATAFKLRGVVTALNLQSGQAGTFDIGNQRFVLGAGASGIDALRNGAFVRVVLGTAPDAQGRWVVSAVGGTAPAGGDRDEAKARGIITSFTSIANFGVGGVVVDASNAKIEGGPLAAGLRVEVEGRLVGGVLVASQVEVENEDEHEPLDLRGSIATLDATAQVFTLAGRSERIGYANTGSFVNGTAADLAVGRRVRAIGQLSADGTLVEATQIRFDN
ncbi:MAG TPA: DUF5666 domain-containing protein [Burkholderiaceae bacterium]|nr:DUF5666 domain-containing protein [Burkholderiaceae bacterium]